MSAVGLLKTTTSVNFETAAKPWLDIRDLLRAAGADQAEIQAPPMVIERELEKKRVTLQVRGVLVEQEAGTDSDMTGGVKKILTALNTASPFPRLTGVRHDIISIEPFAMPFHEVADFLKRSFLKPGRLVDAATDIGIILDRHEDRVLKHIQLGPMDKAQLQSQFLRWPAAALPETFVFIGLGFQRDLGADFTEELLGEFFREADDWQITETAAIIEDLRRG